MNETNVNDVLRELAQAADELAATCDCEAPDYGPVWHALAKNAKAITDPDKLLAENAKFDSLKAMVSAALGRLVAAVTR